MTKHLNALKLKEDVQKKNKKNVDRLFETGEFDLIIESEILLRWLKKIKKDSLPKDSTVFAFNG